MAVEFDEYKGHPMIKLVGPDGRYFSFGKAKAKLIFENLEEIKKFAEE